MVTESSKRESAPRRAAVTMFHSMLVELAVYGAVKLLQNWVHVLVVICATFLVAGALARRSVADRLPFMRGPGGT